MRLPSGERAGRRDPACLGDASDSRAPVLEFSQLFDGIPAVLMAQDASGTPDYYGRTDLINWSSNVPFEALPWATYTVS